MALMHRCTATGQTGMTTGRVNQLIHLEANDLMTLDYVKLERRMVAG